MTRFVIKRLLFVPFAILIIVTLSFGLVNIVPSDPASVKLGGLASPADLVRARHDLGLDQSLPHRYVLFMKNLVLHGDLGKSYYTERPVWSDIGVYLPNTLELIVPALTLAAL